MLQMKFHMTEDACRRPCAVTVLCGVVVIANLRARISHGIEP